MKRYLKLKRVFGFIAMLLTYSSLQAADLPGSKDPDGMKRFEGSTIVAYRAPKFDEFVLPLGRVTGSSPTTYTKSLTVSGLMSRYTYGAPMGTSTLELFQNYKEEFKRLGIKTLFEVGPGVGSFYTVMGSMGHEDGLVNLFEGSSYTGKDRLLVGQSPTSSPAYYLIYVAEVSPGSGPESLKSQQAFAQLIVITPKTVENKMVMSSEEMSKSLKDLGKVILYGIYFDTDQDTIQPNSTPMLQTIAELLKNNSRLKLRVVGHTDDQGTAAHNLDLSKRRAESVVHELASKYGAAAERLDAFGCGLYAPVAPNTSEEGRAKNRRVELLPW